MKKKLFAKAITFALVFLGMGTVSAQNSIQISYGFKKPIGNNLGEAFKPNGGETISFMHQLKDSKWSVGATFNQQKFKTNANYFKDAYEADMSVTNALFSLRKNMFIKDEHYWYWGVDLGMAFDKLRHFKPESALEKSIGFTKGLVIGSIWRVNEQFSIDLNGTYHNIYAEEFNYNHQFSSKRFKYASVNFGVRYQL